MDTQKPEQKINPRDIDAAIETLATYNLDEKLQVATRGGTEMVDITPILWPVIKEMVTLSKAAEAGMLEVRPKI